MPVAGKYKAVPFSVKLADEIAKYPCHVCGDSFRSRKELARHPHKGEARG